MTHIFHPSLLREYDIRGVVSDTLSDKDAYAIGRSFATLVRRAGGRRVAVGYDGRLSSPKLTEALVAGINAAGVDAPIQHRPVRPQSHDAQIAGAPVDADQSGHLDAFIQ